MNIFNQKLQKWHFHCLIGPYKATKNIAQIKWKLCLNGEHKAQLFILFSMYCFPKQSAVFQGHTY